MAAFVHKNKKLLSASFDSSRLSPSLSAGGRQWQTRERYASVPWPAHKETRPLKISAQSSRWRRGRCPVPFARVPEHAGSV